MTLSLTCHNSGTPSVRAVIMANISGSPHLIHDGTRLIRYIITISLGEKNKITELLNLLLNVSRHLNINNADSADEH